MKTRPKQGFAQFISKSLPLTNTKSTKKEEIKTGSRVFYFRNDGTLRVGIVTKIIENDVWATWGFSYENLNLHSTFVDRSLVHLYIPKTTIYSYASSAICDSW